jgi:ribosomal-protein-alanine N-acetyltransferase
VKLLPARPVFVEPALETDVETLSEIHGRCFGRAWSPDELAALVAEGNVTCLVLRRIGFIGRRRALGFVIVRSAADEAEVLTIAVEPACRKRGYGRLLLEEAMRRLYRDRIAHLYLEVDAGNRAALALYRRLGFDRIGERPGYYQGAGGVRSTALVMRAHLR